MIKAIVLDLDGVYYKKGGLWPYSQWCQKKLDLNEQEVHQLIFGSDYYKKFKLGHISEDKFWDLVQLNSKTLIDKEEFIKQIAKGFEVDKALLDYMMRLKDEKGIVLGICSNTDTSMNKSRALNDLSPKNFDFQVFSYKVGLQKPDANIFKIVVEKSKCRSEEIIYADDNPKTLVEAKLMGINTHIYESFESFYEFCIGLDSNLI